MQTDDTVPTALAVLEPDADADASTQAQAPEALPELDAFAGAVQAYAVPDGASPWAQIVAAAFEGVRGIESGWTPTDFRAAVNEMHAEINVKAAAANLPPQDERTAALLVLAAAMPSSKAATLWLQNLVFSIVPALATYDSLARGRRPSEAAAAQLLEASAAAAGEEPRKKVKTLAALRSGSSGGAATVP